MNVPPRIWTALNNIIGQVGEDEANGRIIDEDMLADCDAIAEWMGTTPPNSEDNARLIAAAPDLLEALTRCYLDLVNVMPEYEPSVDRIHPGWKSIKEARAAIIKAGGAA